MGVEAAQVHVSSSHLGVEETSAHKTDRYSCMCRAHTGWRPRTMVSVREEGFLSNVGEKWRFGCVIFLEGGTPPPHLEDLNLNQPRSIDTRAARRSRITASEGLHGFGQSSLARTGNHGLPCPRMFSSETPRALPRAGLEQPPIHSAWVPCQARRIELGTQNQN